MLSKRIIACLDVRDGKLAKSVKFVDTRDIGDPVEQARKYYEAGVQADRKSAALGRDLLRRRQDCRVERFRGASPLGCERPFAERLHPRTDFLRARRRPRPRRGAARCSARIQASSSAWVRSRPHAPSSPLCVNACRRPGSSSRR